MHKKELTGNDKSVWTVSARAGCLDSPTGSQSGAALLRDEGYIGSSWRFGKILQSDCGDISEAMATKTCVSPRYIPPCHTSGRSY